MSQLNAITQVLQWMHCQLVFQAIRIRETFNGESDFFQAWKLSSLKAMLDYQETLSYNL